MVSRAFLSSTGMPPLPGGFEAGHVGQQGLPLRGQLHHRIPAPHPADAVHLCPARHLSLLPAQNNTTHLCVHADPVSNRGPAAMTALASA